MDAKDRKIKELEAVVERLRGKLTRAQTKGPSARRFELVLRVVEDGRVVTEEARAVPQLSASEIALENTDEARMFELVAAHIRAMPVESMVAVLVRRARIRPVW